MGGDILSGFSPPSRLVEGAAAHRVIQSRLGEGYATEVRLASQVETEGIVTELSGRADAVFDDGSRVIVEEIKSTSRDLNALGVDTDPGYWLQALCYAFMYLDGLADPPDDAVVRIVYCDPAGASTRALERTFTRAELEITVRELVAQYAEWAVVVRDWGMERDESIRTLEFPFSGYRGGQRTMAKEVYRAVRDGSTLFIRAPTGIGKTVAALFPAVKALGEGLTAKVFYLTATGVTKSVAEDTLARLRMAGVRLKSITLTAREKICFNESVACHPDLCPFAKGHYDRVKAAIAEAFTSEALTRDRIEEVARRHRVCPFELSLDLSLWVDAVICDYNYAFDPRAYLRRFFVSPWGAFTFLVDEAHNLVDRAREMFSAELRKQPLLRVKRLARQRGTPETLRAAEALQGVNKWFLQARKRCDPTSLAYVEQARPDDLIPLLSDLVRASETVLLRNERTALHQELLDLYFEVQGVLLVSQGFDARYRTLVERNGADVRLRLWCVDPSFLMGQALQRARAAVFYSATLAPIDYFVRILGGGEGAKRVELPSPFPPEHLGVLVEGSVATLYARRRESLPVLGEVICAAAESVAGNMLVFFPSFEYLAMAEAEVRERGGGLNIDVQRRDMADEERRQYLERFRADADPPILGFAVMGGIFGEGIDLVGDRLQAAMIVGVGLPQICLERDLIRQYFDEQEGVGFDYAYVYPGMNRVLQATGRVIRTESDRGVVILVDRRFITPRYRRLFPPEWRGLRTARGAPEVRAGIKGFVDARPPTDV